MKIVNVKFSKGLTGFFFDDQVAIKANAKVDGAMYVGEPMTSNFDSIRQKGESVSIILIAEDGTVGVGDAAAVQYSGCGGRDSLFKADDYIEFLDRELKPLMIGHDLSSFRVLAEHFDNLIVNGARLHTAIRYGVTQAILSLVAKVKKKTIAEVIQEEYDINEHIAKPKLFAQTGDSRYENVDKMIIKEVDVIPHGLINNIETKLGQNGELLKEYIIWMRDRILKFSRGYHPKFHIDVYGTIALIMDNNISKIASYLKELEEAAKPFALAIEGPGDMGNREEQVAFLKELTKYLDDNNINVDIVADEWCNTLEDIELFAKEKAGHMLQIKTPDLGGVNNVVEAVLICKKYGVKAYSGGTCNETNISSEITTNIAMATGAEQLLAKPGMGTDEGIMIVTNEMNRVMALIGE